MPRFIHTDGSITADFPDSLTEYYLSKGFKFADAVVFNEEAPVDDDTFEFSVEDPDAEGEPEKPAPKKEKK